MGFPQRIAVLIVSALLSFHSYLFAQESSPPQLPIGTIKGAVIDSIHNTFLQSATVAIYKEEDSALVKYQLTNNFGEFQFTGLPIDVNLKIVVSYIGYKSLSRKFRLSNDQHAMDLKILNLERGEESMQEVVVKTVPPVRMNGDTLEFNAAAFSLDKNAVAEDLLKKLPGVIVWGDGTITVNGKQIKQLLVEGKPFFGDDAKIATQNLPKEAIQKIQVYKEQLNPYNPLDSIITVNIKLKTNSRVGHFGEIGAGYGTDKQYQADASLNFYSPRTLLGAAAASNNVNKIANDIYTLMRNSTYKGVSATVDYQPDFTLQGVNKSISGGFAYQHDFIPDPSSYKQDRFTANAFLGNTINQTSQSYHTISSITPDSLLTSDNISNSKTNATGFNFGSEYEKRKDENDFSIGAAINTQKNNSQIQQQNTVYGTGQDLESSDYVHDSAGDFSRAVTLRSAYSHAGFTNNNTHGLRNWKAEYSLNIGKYDTSRMLNTNFYSVFNPLASQVFNRNYNDGSNYVNQNLSLAAGDFATWLFGNNNRLSNYRIIVKNDLSVNYQNLNNLIKDEETAADVYQINPYLSNNATRHTINERPQLDVSRNFMNILANRFQKDLSFNLNAAMQFYSESSSSVHSFLNYSRNYQRLIPSASISYTNFRFGTYQNKYDLQFSVSSIYPNADQLYLLVDSSSVYNIRFGNPSLVPSTVNVLAFNFRHDAYRSKNTFNYGLRLSASFINDFLADSAIIDQYGRYYYYTVNLNGNRAFHASFFLNKAMKFGYQQLQINFAPHFDLSRIPGLVTYITGNGAIRNVSNTTTNSDTLSIGYTWKDVLAINLSEILGFYTARQSGLTNNAFSSDLSITRLGVGATFMKKLLFRSSISYDRSKSSGLAATNFTIWNADAAYRLLPDNTLELKFSALDLLHQNKGILNYGSNYSLTHETVNVLQQYFMLTISYFPRKFHK